MAYVTQYKCEFDNQLNERVLILIQLDGGSVPGTVEDLPVIDGSCFVNVNGGEDLFAPILVREFVCELHVDQNSAVDWQTFIASTHSEWRILVTIDGQDYFHGYLLPDEGPSPWQDKPYSVTIRATDGLKLLDKEKLTDVNGDEFDNENLLIDYLAGALAKTRLQLPIRVYTAVSHVDQLNYADGDYNMFNQTRLDYRTFMKSATDFENCYRAIEILLKDAYRIYYDNGMWVVYRLGEFQYRSTGLITEYGGGPLKYVDFDHTGTVTGGGTSADFYIPVGKNELNYAHSETQIVSSEFANKSTTTSFKYDIWPEIPRNAKFSRGTLFDSTAGPLTGQTTKRYTIDDWTFGKTQSTNPAHFGLPTIVATTGTAYRRSVFNAFGVELTREIELTAALDSPFFDVLLSEYIPVNEGDIIELSFLMRVTTAAGLTGMSGVYVFIVPSDASATLFLDNNLGANTSDQLPWVASGKSLYVQWNGASAATYTAVTEKGKPIPKDGKLYIALYGGNTTTYGAKLFKDVNLTYTPMIAGGYVPITGDYWTTTQTRDYPDNRSEEVFLSDSLKQLIKGTLLNASGPAQELTPEWRRGDSVELRHYKQIVNIGIFNLTYRRFWRIEGDFRGTKTADVLAPGVLRPISFTDLYKMVDMGDDRFFALSSPLKIDLTKGSFTAVFHEVYCQAEGDDGNGAGDSSEFNYTFE